MSPNDFSNSSFKGCKGRTCTSSPTSRPATIVGSPTCKTSTTEIRSRSSPSFTSISVSIISRERERAFRTAFSPRSMRLANSISPSRVKKRNHAHLAQINANGIIVLIHRAGDKSSSLRSSASSSFLVNSFDSSSRSTARTLQISVDVVEVRIYGQIFWHDAVDFVVKCKALIVAVLHQLPLLPHAQTQTAFFGEAQCKSTRL